MSDKAVVIINLPMAPGMLASLLTDISAVVRRFGGEPFVTTAADDNAVVVWVPGGEK